MRRTPTTELKPSPLIAPSTVSRVLQRKCDCGSTPTLGGECDECREKKQWPLQTKLTISEPGDAYELEADSIADKVTSTPPFPRGHAAPAIQRYALQSHGPRDVAPESVHQALVRPGNPLDSTLRQEMEQHFGRDFSGVRVHTDAIAGRSAQEVNARAYTVGRDIVFGPGSYAPETAQGRRLLAHELTHVVQQREAGARPALQRFELSEKPKIAPTFNDMLNQIKTLIDAATTSGLIWDDLNMDFLVEISGGKSASRAISNKLGSASPTIKSRLLLRYLFTCRCGLIDMRHFLQMFYISNFAAGSAGISQAAANRIATRKGREHELSAPDSQSRFSAEDTPSNALGAFTNIGLAARPQPGRVYDAIKDILALCGPVDFSALSSGSKDTIVHYYADRIPDPVPKKPGDQIPKFQNETAVPAVLDIKECAGRERSFPFSLDTSDSDRKTLSDNDFEKGSTALTKGSSIRDFIHTQRPEVLKALPTSEKIRMLKVLLGGTVSGEDLKAASRLDSMMSAAEKAIWQQHLPLAPDD